MIENKYEIKHEGISISIEGGVDIHFNRRSISFMDTFYGSNKSIALVDDSFHLIEKGRLAPGIAKFPYVNEQIEVLARFDSI